RPLPTPTRFPSTTLFRSRFLAHDGYRISTAEDAAQARAKLAGLRFDLLILDVTMPGESGFELARSIRSQSSVPILMLTARSDPRSEEHTSELQSRENLVC